MSKKNDLGRRKRQHEFGLQREQAEKEKRMKKLAAKKNKMKLDGTNKKKKNKKGFQVGQKKLKTMPRQKLNKLWKSTNEVGFSLFVLKTLEI